uniref:Uncharacterized protein n=1 Tax=Erinnyis ello granulovirus TaxID=307444 RepID=A0A288WI82_9BBAC|nr:hypothetical protein EREL_059 [Erinnyis ello granulovirus]ARX72048.1 hypothetical protein EREL_059 [Erinnyis ello granulovirus]
MNTTSIMYQQHYTYTTKKQFIFMCCKFVSHRLQKITSYSCDEHEYTDQKVCENFFAF